MRALNDQMVDSDFEVKGGFWHFAKATQTDTCMFLKGVTSNQNRHLLISLSLLGNYEM